jgi:hypothetical protein
MGGAGVGDRVGVRVRVIEGIGVMLGIRVGVRVSVRVGVRTTINGLAYASLLGHDASRAATSRQNMIMLIPKGFIFSFIFKFSFQ